MYVPFDSIAPSSRLWIYQSDRKFSQPEIQTLSNSLRQFCDEWAAHGQPLKTSFDIRFKQFILLVADEAFNAASGCSIDESVRVIKQIESSLGTKLFDRSQAAFLIQNEVVLIPLDDLKQKFNDGIWNELTPSFNNLIATKGQLEQEWAVPAGKTWLKRYVPLTRVTT